jgi:hypothetical protein
MENRYYRISLLLGDRELVYAQGIPATFMKLQNAPSFRIERITLCRQDGYSTQTTDLTNKFKETQQRWKRWFTFKKTVLRQLRLRETNTHSLPWHLLKYPE